MDQIDGKKVSCVGNVLEVISKPRIRSESKAQVDEKAQQPLEVVSILKRLATRLSGLRWGFEMASNPWGGLGGVRHPDRSLLRTHPNIYKQILRLRPCSNRIEFPYRSGPAVPGAGPGFGFSYRWARYRLSTANHLISESRSADLFCSFSYWSSLTK